MGENDPAVPPPQKKKRTTRGNYFNYFEPSSKYFVPPRQTITSQAGRNQQFGNVNRSEQPLSAAIQVEDNFDRVNAAYSQEDDAVVDQVSNRSDLDRERCIDQEKRPKNLSHRQHPRNRGSDSSSSDSTDESDCDDLTENLDIIFDPRTERLVPVQRTKEDTPQTPCAGLCICSHCHVICEALQLEKSGDTEQSSAARISLCPTFSGGGENVGGDGGENVGGAGGENMAGAENENMGGAEGENVGWGRESWNEKYKWKDPLLPNLETTKFEDMLMVLHLVMRHGMTGPLIEDLLKFVNVLFGQEVIPTSQLIFKKLYAPHVSLQFHFYCNKCERYLGEKTTFSETTEICSCGSVNKVDQLTDNNFFVTFSVKEQLEEILKRPNFKILSRSDKNGTLIKDILDGELYKNFFGNDEPVTSEHSLTITFNTDGAPVWSGPRGSIWPILYIVNEAAPNIRFRTENVLLCGLYYGKTSPNMSTFFTPFVKEMQKLAVEGVRKKCENGSEVLCPVFATTCSVDLIAKAKLQVCKQCNGKYGCGYCLHPNDTKCEDLPQNQGRYSTKSDEYPYPLRNHEQMVEDMFQAHARNQRNLLKDESVRGMMGLSPLLGLPRVNIRDLFTIDYMHLVKGVSEKMCEVFFDSSAYVSIDAAKVSRRLAEIKPPHTMTRFPHSLKYRPQYKAKEYIALLLYCLPACTVDLLPPRNLKNVCDLVEGLHILLRDNISLVHIERADRSLSRFLREFNALYGDRHMTANMHLLSHLADLVRKW